MALGSSSLPRANFPERLFDQLAQRNGWVATKRGWPDFLVFTEEGEMIAVEVKPRRRDHLPGMKTITREQQRCMDTLTKHGIRCFVSDGMVMEPYDPKIHARESRRSNRGRLKHMTD